MENQEAKIKALIGLSLLSVGLCACSVESQDKQDKPEIKQCADAGGIPIRSVWDERMLAGCTFKPAAK